RIPATGGVRRDPRPAAIPGDACINRCPPPRDGPSFHDEEPRPSSSWPGLFCVPVDYWGVLAFAAGNDRAAASWAASATVRSAAAEPSPELMASTTYGLPSPSWRDRSAPPLGCQSPDRCGSGG